MEQASTRDVLHELAESPIGTPELQAEADRIAHRGIKPSGELKQTIKRAAKIWLPQGKKAAVRGACNEPSAQQCDIEDAIEAAGGRRGGTPEQVDTARSPLLTVAKHNREFATLFRGQFAMESPGHYSIFKRKRDAEAYADFLNRLFGADRLAAMESDETARPTNDERDQMRAELKRLQAD